MWVRGRKSKLWLGMAKSITQRGDRSGKAPINAIDRGSIKGEKIKEGKSLAGVV